MSSTSNQSSISYRPNASAGIWCCFLIPLALLFSNIHVKDDFQTICTWISFYFALSSLQVLYKLHYELKRNGIMKELKHMLLYLLESDLVKPTNTREEIPNENQSEIKNSESLIWSKSKFDDFKNRLYLTVIFSNLFYTFGPIKLMSVSLIILVLPFLHAYPVLLVKLFKKFPQCFTFGEGTLVNQAIFIFVFRQVFDGLYEIEDASTIQGSFTIIGRAVLFSVILFCLITSRSPTWFYVTGVFILIGITLPYLWLTLHRNPIFWVIHYIIEYKMRFFLLSGWLGLMILAVIFMYVFKNSQVDTIIRKGFHGLISLVYLSGVLLDVNLLYLGTIGALCVFVLVEFVRINKIDPLSKFFNENFRAFLDNKDCGSLIITNIYLLVGCSLPLWLTPSLVECDVLILLSGVLSIGIGDSAASIIGYKYGKIKWPQSNKSIEGTLSSIFAQLFIIFILKIFNITLNKSLWEIMIPITLSSIIEALTNQVDNIVLPLITFIFFNIY